MQATAPAAAAHAMDRHQEFDKRKLFILAVIACTTNSISFSLRTSIAGDVQKAFFDPIDPIHSATLLGIGVGHRLSRFCVHRRLRQLALDFLGMRNILSSAV